jgi:hypothetical protein
MKKNVTTEFLTRPTQGAYSKEYSVPAATKTKDVREMLGEFFREAAVLITVFFPLEMARNSSGKVSLVFMLLVAAVVLSSLLMGIALEKLR